MKYILLLSLTLLLSFSVSGEDLFPKADSLRPGDVLYIKVLNHLELELKVNVETDFYIQYPLCGKILVMNKTLHEISDLISAKLAKNNFERPQVSIFVEKFAKRYVYVVGEVKKSAAIEINPGLRRTVLQVIAASEGFTEKADKTGVFVLRTIHSGKTQSYPLDVLGVLSRKEGAKDFPLIPGDTVVVPTSKPVSVLGQVKEAIMFNIQADVPMSISQAIAMAGGFDKLADEEEIILIRDKKTSRKKNEMDFSLLPGDTVIVPSAKPVSVLGQVKNAKMFNIQPDITMTISQAIAMAGGFDKLADEDEVLLIRNKKVSRINLKKLFKTHGDIEQNVQIQPGDVIFVTESKW